MTNMDDVKKDSPLGKLWVNGLVIVLTSLFFYTADLRGSSFAGFLAPAIGTGDDIGNGGRLLMGLFLALLFLLNLQILRVFSFSKQVKLVWLELLLLFLFFFYTFNLDYNFISQKVGFMITQGAFTTLYISAISICIAFILALAGAIAKLSSNAIAVAIANFYTSFFRGLPLLMQVYLLYIGLPQLGFMIDAVPSGIIALSLCYGAYMTEIFRSGLLSIPRGQWEASRSLAFNNYQTLRYIVLPQSVRVIIPPTGNMFISMLKDSSLVSVLGVWELMFLSRTLGQEKFKHLEMLITASLIYWILSMVLELIQARIEKKYQSI